MKEAHRQMHSRKRHVWFDMLFCQEFLIHLQRHVWAMRLCSGSLELVARRNVWRFWGCLKEWWMKCMTRPIACCDLSMIEIQRTLGVDLFQSLKHQSCKQKIAIHLLLVENRETVQAVIKKVRNAWTGNRIGVCSGIVACAFDTNWLRFSSALSHFNGKILWLLYQPGERWCHSAGRDSGGIWRQVRPKSCLILCAIFLT